MAKVSTSADEARGLGFLLEWRRHHHESRARADRRQGTRPGAGSRGYEPPVPRTDIPAPGENILATLKLGVHIMRQGEYITDHEVKIGNKVAEVLCGGTVTPGRR